ncbi:hypothetical protein BC332_05571 [Capsicum chinense]|nr:hypothetical protein BC332_05571 [Capsicum chinense]
MHVISSIEEPMGSKQEQHLTITKECHVKPAVAQCFAIISFTDDDSLLGSKLYNRPLFVVGAIREQHLNRILIDDGSAVNIMPRTVFKRLRISIDKLSKINITIQGFNQGGQQVMRKISVELSIGNMKSNILIHVIDAKTSYNLLLGRPWLHENGVVTSTLHQRMKYMKDDEVVKVDTDIHPYTEIESYFADSKFYLDPCVAKMSKKSTKGIAIKFSSSEGDIKEKTDDEPLVFRYIPRERRREGQPLLEASTQQVLHPRKEISHEMLQDLKKSMTVPVVQIQAITPESSRNDTLVEKIKGHFDQKAFTLLEKSGYDFSNPTRLGELKDEVTGEKIHGLTASQMKLRKQGHYVATPKFRLGFKLPKPLRISARKVKKMTSSYHISVEGKKKGEDEKIPQQKCLIT